MKVHSPLEQSSPAPFRGSSAEVHLQELGVTCIGSNFNDLDSTFNKVSNSSAAGSLDPQAERHTVIVVLQ